MIWILLPLIFICIFLDNLWFGSLGRPDGLADWIIAGFLGIAIGGILGGILAVTLGCGLGFLFGAVPVESETYQLVALRDKDGVQGQFFLGAGTGPSFKFHVPKGTIKTGYMM